jgi:amino acid transporter
MLSFFVTAGVLVGFDASGHVAEETKNASITAARGVFYSALASGLIGFPILILFLFCTPDLDTLYSFDSPQPFVNLYALALGQNGHCVMTTVAILGLLLNTSVAIIAASRLIFAIARDGVLPLSWWIARVSPDGQPRNAVKVIWIVAAALLCTILPSPVAFTSLVSAAGVPTITAYALIACTFHLIAILTIVGRFFLTPGKLTHAKWNLGRWSRPMTFITLIWNLFAAAVLFSPIYFPVTNETFNYACVIWGAITVFGVLCWWFMPEEQWLRSKRIAQVIDVNS